MMMEARGAMMVVGALKNDDSRFARDQTAKNKKGGGVL